MLDRENWTYGFRVLAFAKMLEAEDFFNGMKSAEEVSAVVQNRVQLYMDENR